MRRAAALRSPHTGPAWIHSPRKRREALTSAFDPLRTLGSDPSLGNMTTKSATGTQLWLGLATLVVLGLASVAFGFDHVGRFCWFATPALVVTSAMRKGVIPSVSGRHELVRAKDPRGFWVAVGLGVALAGAALWSFVDNLQR